MAWNFGDIQLYIDEQGRAACLPIGTTPVNTLSLPINGWSHLVCTQQGTTWRLYLNGSATKVTNSGPSAFRNPPPDGSFDRACLGKWYISGADMTNTANPCGGSSQADVPLTADISMLHIYRDYTLTTAEVDNLHLCDDTTCPGTVRTVGTATASGTITAPVTVTATTTATAIRTVPATTTTTAVATMIIPITSTGSMTATVVQTGTQVRSAHGWFGW